LLISITKKATIALTISLLDIRLIIIPMVGISIKYTHRKTTLLLILALNFSLTFIANLCLSNFQNNILSKHPNKYPTP